MSCISCGAEAVGDDGLCAACSAKSFELSLARPRTARGLAPSGGAPLLAFAPGEPFGSRYTVVEEVGAGGMGQVYKALDRTLGRTVALKLIRPGSDGGGELVARFRRELALAQAVTHPNVCRVHDLGEVRGAVYISMEFIEGQSLEDLIRSVGHLSPRQTLALGRQVCAGLAAIHEKAIVHRDLKPSNVMVDREGHARVMDFGMAYHPQAEKLTVEGNVLGTLAYVAPEAARGAPPDVRSDLYAVGIVLFEMLTGRRPPGDDSGLPLALREPPEPCPPPSRLAPEVPAAVDAIVLRCLERDPARRFATARDVDAALGRALDTISSSTTRVPLPFVRIQAGTRRFLPVLAIALAVVAAALLAARALRPSKPASVALLSLAYEGPAQSEAVRDLLPLLLTERLRSATGIEVAPFTSSRGFGPRDDVRSVARQLGVSFIVEGDVRVLGERLQGGLRLLSSADGRPVWSRPLEGDLANPFPDSAAIAGELASALGRRAPPLRRGPDPRALLRYAEGKRLLEGWDVERNHAKAAAAFADAVRLDATFAEAHAGLALARWKEFEETGNAALVEEAKTAADRALSLAPALPEAHLAMGAVLLGRGQSAEAAASFEEALRLAPADDGACRRIADAYASLGRADDALRFFDRAIALRPAYWWNPNAKGAFYLRTGRLGPARSLFNEVIRLHPDSDTGYSNLATSYLLEGRPADALPLLAAALRINPSPQAHNALGLAHYAAGRYADAAEDFQHAIGAGSEDLTYYGNLGDALRQSGRRADARRAYDRAAELGRAGLALRPEDAETRAELAMFLAGGGQCPEALVETHRVESADPTLHYYVAIASALCGDRAAALEHARRAVAGGVVMDVETNPDLRSLLDDRALRDALGAARAKPSS
jgi:serine/threonine-protein kinase